MNLKFEKFKIKTSAIIAGIVVFGLILPQVVRAQVSPKTIIQGAGAFIELFKNLTPAGIAQAILSFVIQFVFWLLHWLVRAGAEFFNAMLNLGFTSHLDIVKAGWQVTRDFSNMFFILFMVVIAFATILRIERYGWRQLLPKVIIIALLINFSYVLCAVIIDFSNIAANFFIRDIKRYTGDDVAGSFTTSLNLLKVYTPVNCNELSDVVPTAPPDYSGPELVSPREKCLQQQSALAQASQIGSDFFTFLISMTVGSLIFLVAAFVLFAGGILLLIRIVFIWFLVMIVPLVFLCYIMPALYQQWRKWWNSFLSWCFFAPLFAFFIWLAMKVSIEGRTQEVARLNSADFTGLNAFSNIFTSAPATALIHYFFIIALLVGGLIAAKQLGLHGAAAIYSIGQKWGKGVKNWAKQTSIRPVKGAGEKIGAGALLAGSKLFGDTKLGRRLEAKARQIRRAPEERPEHAKYAKLLSTMANENILREVETARGVRKLIATREAQKRGLLREAKRNTITEATKAMRAFGASDAARTLEELRPDAIREATERNAAVERAIKEGIHKKWSNEVFKGLEGQQIIGELQRQLTPTEFSNVFKGWAQDVKDSAETAMKAGFTGDFRIPAPGKKNENIDKRRAFAKATGKVSEAFAGDTTGETTRDYFESLSDEGFGNLRTDEDKKLAAKYMTEKQVEGAGIKFTGKDKRLVMDEVRSLAKTDAERRRVLEQMERSLAWGGGTPSRTVDLREEKMTKEEAVDEIRKQAQKLETEEEKKKKTGSITDESITD